MSAEHGQDPAVGGTEDESLGWRQRFRYWRASRPFWAGVITAFAGLWLIWSPQVAIGGLAITIGIVTDGWLIGALLIILAIGIWLQPQVRGLAGAMIIVLSLGSFIKINFGGFLIGMLAGLVGGAMAIAWTPDVPHDELEDEFEEQPFEEQPFEEPSDQLIPMGDYRDDRRGVISTAEPDTEPVGEAVEPAAPDAAPPDRSPDPTPHEQPPAPRPTEMAPAPVRPSWPAVEPNGDRTSSDAGRTTITLSGAVAIVSLLAVVVLLGAASAAVGQDGSPTPSPTPSPSEPPSPTPTPTVPPSPSTSPTATPSASPTAKPSPTAEPSPTTTPPEKVRAAAGEPQPAGMTGRLTADSSTMSGLQFDGVITYQDTPHGTVRALRFTADRNELNDMTLRVTIGGVATTISDGTNDTTVLAGNVVMDVTRIAGSLGGVPVEFTPDNPPPGVASSMVLTDLSADLVLVQADRMDIPEMSQAVG